MHFLSRHLGYYHCCCCCQYFYFRTPLSVCHYKHKGLQELITFCIHSLLKDRFPTTGNYLKVGIIEARTCRLSDNSDFKKIFSQNRNIFQLRYRYKIIRKRQFSYKEQYFQPLKLSDSRPKSPVQIKNISDFLETFPTYIRNHPENRNFSEFRESWEKSPKMFRFWRIGCFQLFVLFFLL